MSIKDTIKSLEEADDATTLVTVMGYYIPTLKG